MQVLGTDDLNAYLNKYHLELDPQLEALVGRFVIYNLFSFIFLDSSSLISKKKCLKIVLFFERHLIFSIVGPPLSIRSVAPLAWRIITIENDII